MWNRWQASDRVTKSRQYSFDVHSFIHSYIHKYGLNLKYVPNANLNAAETSGRPG